MKKCNISFLVILLFFSFNFFAEEAKKWTIAAEAFSYESVQSDDNISDGISKTLPLIILEKLDANIVRNVEIMVKKYASIVTPLKKITPHKMRSTYGTNLYQETGDIYLVADVLGHADVNTTRKHYADIEDGRRRMAATRIKLRKD